MYIPTTTLTTGGGGDVAALYDEVLSAQGTFDVSGISQAYLHLEVRLSILATAEVNLNMRFNNDSGANYAGQVLTATSGTVAAAGGGGTTQIHIGYVTTLAAAGKTVVQIPDYTGSLRKGAIGHNSVTLAGGFYWVGSSGSWASTDAINRIQIFPASGAFEPASRITIYGFSS